MKILFYLEPSLFRDDPSLLLPWAGWVARIASANSGLEISCASNLILVQRLASFSSVACHVLTQAAVSGALNFDRHAYSRDLYAAESAAPANTALVGALDRLAEHVRPDLVVSFSHNRYLRSAFGTPVLFSEMGPLPRARCRPTLFFDALGHQRPNLLTYEDSRALRQELTQERSDALLALYEENIVTPTLNDPLSVQLGECVALRRGGKKLALFAMQPAGWLTYEGLHTALAPADLIMSWAAQLPVGWKGVVSYHPGHRLPCSAEELIAAECENVIFLPAELSSGNSEKLLPHVDAVVTISSTVALQGALLGKRLVCAEGSAWHGMSAQRVADLDCARSLSGRERASLLFFLTNRYCHAFERVLDERDYFASLVRSFVAGGFSPDLYFDESTWDSELALDLLSLPAP